MNITSGKIQSAKKIVVYGPEGIGKSTFAAQMPKPLFSDTEGSTKMLDVARFDKPSSWEMLLSQARYVRDNPEICSTYVIDTADWAEQLCIRGICDGKKVDGIEDIGYGKGYVYVSEAFAVLLSILEEIIERGINVVLTAHAKIRKFEQPDEMGAYDRWELKLSKQVAPLVKEWSDMLLFANYKTLVINVDGKGSAKGKNKAQGGQRVMYTAHSVSWDAKNRDGMPEELPFEYAQIATYIPDLSVQAKTKVNEERTRREVDDLHNETVSAQQEEAKRQEKAPEQSNGMPKELTDLMTASSVTENEIRQAVAYKGYYPEDTPIENYDREFVAGVLVGAWSQVFEIIKQMRESLPFEA